VTLIPSLSIAVYKSGHLNIILSMSQWSFLQLNKLGLDVLHSSKGRTLLKSSFNESVLEKWPSPAQEPDPTEDSSRRQHLLWVSSLNLLGLSLNYKSALCTHSSFLCCLQIHITFCSYSSFCFLFPFISISPVCLVSLWVLFSHLTLNTLADILSEDPLPFLKSTYI
jgi:hypothetical protein